MEKQEEKQEKSNRQKIMDISIVDNGGVSYAEVIVPAHGDKAGRRAFYSLDNLLKALDTSKEIVTKEENKTLDLGLIPPDMYTGSFVTNSEGDVVGHTAAFTIPGKVRKFSYDLWTEKANVKERGETNIPFPNLLFVASEKNGHTSRLRVYAYVGNLLTPQTVLYNYPLGNVSGGGVCMGGFGMDVSDFYGLYTYVQAFFDLRTNDDLYGSSSNSSGLTQLDFVKKLEGLETFPTEYLVSAGKTVENVLK